MDQDRLSNTSPTFIVRNIVDEFDFHQLGVLLLVSKRISELCLMVSSVNVDFSRTTENRREELGLRLGRYLHQRRLEKYLALSELSLNRVCIHSCMVYSWILDAAYCNLTHLTLGIKPGFHASDFSLPPRSCHILNSLSLNLQGGRFKIPQEEYPVLETLKLEMLISDGDLGVWLSTSCPSVKELFLREVSGIINLNLSMQSLCFLKFKKLRSNDLRRLSISSNSVKAIWINWIKTMVAGTRRLELNTPGLVFLGIQGSMPVFEHLVFGDRTTQVFIDLAKFWMDPDVPIWTNINSLIGSVIRTGHLKIKGRLIQVMQDNQVNLCPLIRIPSISVYVTSAADIEALRSILRRARTTGLPRIPERIVVSYMPTERVVGQARFAHSNQVRGLAEEIELFRVAFPVADVVVETLQRSGPGISFDCPNFD